MTEQMQVLVLAFVIAGIIGWAIYRKLVLGEQPQPIWQSPEYLRYNRTMPVSRQGL